VPEQPGIVKELWRAADEAGDWPGSDQCRQGIVICAGGPVMLTNAYVLLRVLRDIPKCELPIEIWHLGTHEMPGFIADMFVAMGCRIKDASSRLAERDNRISDGWQLKSYALCHSQFEQVLLLDADQVPLKDPAELFEWPEFQRTGAVAWPDIIDISEQNPAWTMLGLQPRQVCSWESGQLCVDRRRHWRAINLALEMNRRADTFYQLVYGDKDIFLLAWLLCGSDFALVPERPYQSDYFLCQRDFAGTPLFQHRSNCKWSLTEENFQPDGFGLALECEAILEELREVWDGRIFHAPSRSLAARRAEQALMEQRNFEYAVATQPASSAELLPGHQIGKGRSDNLVNWYVRDGDAGLELIFCDRLKIFATLSQDHDGNWAGKTTAMPRKDIKVFPASDDDTKNHAVISSGGLAGDLVRSVISRADGQNSGIDHLKSAIWLLADADATTAADARAAALFYAAEYPDISEQLEKLAGELEAALGQAQRPVARSPFTMIGDKNFYVRD
jgi:hypothetical protein